MMSQRSASIVLLILAASSSKALQTPSRILRNRMMLWCGTESQIHAPLSPNDTTPVAPTTLSLEQLLSPVSSCDVTQMGPTTWAYVGDVVFELFVRSQMVWPTRRTSELQEKVVSLVRGELLFAFEPAGEAETINSRSCRFLGKIIAEHQAKLLALLTENFALTAKELQIVVRGRNSGSVKGNRRKTPAYNDATALEALLGYVYMTDKDRCSEILNYLLVNLQVDDQS